MERIGQAWNALVAQPISIVMVLIALWCAGVAISFGVRRWVRVLTLLLAVISGAAAWIMASRWRWPS